MRETLAQTAHLGLRAQRGLSLPDGSEPHHRKGFVSLRYPFEELFSLNSVVIPRPSDPLHAVATKIREALIE